MGDVSTATVFCGRQRSVPSPSIVVLGNHESTACLSALFWAFYVNGIIQGVVFCEGLLSPRIMFSSFICVLMCIMTSLLFAAK